MSRGRRGEVEGCSVAGVGLSAGSEQVRWVGGGWWVVVGEVGGGVSGRECTMRGVSRRRELRVGVWQGCRRVGASRCLVEDRGGAGSCAGRRWEVGSDVKLSAFLASLAAR